MSYSYILIFQVLTIAVLNYAIYRHRLHPLRIYPGPFLASFSNAWFVLLLTALPLIIFEIHRLIKPTGSSITT